MMSQHNDPELTIEEQIQANATMLIKHMWEEVGVELKDDEESVKWIEDYVERSRTTSDQETIDLLISALVSFVGECIRHQFGGQWKPYPGQWGIEFRPGNMAFPFTKLRKQFANGRGEGDSILGFYQTIPGIFSDANLKTLKTLMDSLSNNSDIPTE